MVDEGIIAREASVISLQKLSEKYTAAVRDIGQAQIKRQQLAEEIDRSVSRLGSQWDREAVRCFAPTHAQEDSIQSFRSRLEEAKGRVDDARAKLEYHKEQKAASASRGFSAFPLPRYALVATTLFGLVGTIYGLVIAEWVLAGLLALIPLVGVWAMVRTIKGPPAKVMDPTEKALSERFAKEREERERLEAEWENLLLSIGLGSGLSVSGASEAVRAILEVQASLISLDDLDSRIGQMQGTIDKVVQMHGGVVEDVGGTPTTEDIAANIELLSSALGDAKTTKLSREGLQTQIDRVAAKVATLSEERNRAAERVAHYVASFGCSDVDDFRSRWATYTKQSELLAKMDECRRRLQTAIGTGEHFSDFISSISSASPELIQSELDEVRGRRTELGEERDTMNTTLGELRAGIVRLSSGQDLLVKQSDVEVKLQQLRDCAVDWVRWQIALAVLDSAIAKHESTRQPQVIKAAEELLSRMTDGRYPRIVKRLDDNELVVRDAEDRSRELTELSRGTREELYLAMRLGLIEEYEKRSESMSVIMDDILANFDDDRGPLAVQLIAKFAENRQVIVLTCHKNTYDRYCQSGAKPVDLV